MRANVIKEKHFFIDKRRVTVCLVKKDIGYMITVDGRDYEFECNDMFAMQAFNSI